MDFHEIIEYGLQFLAILLGYIYVYLTAYIPYKKSREEEKKQNKKEEKKSQKKDLSHFDKEG